MQPVGVAAVDACGGHRPEAGGAVVSGRRSGAMGAPSPGGEQARRCHGGAAPPIRRASGRRNSALHQRTVATRPKPQRGEDEPRLTTRFVASLN